MRFTGFAARLYDLVQQAAGAKRVSRILAEELADLPPGGWMLDVGGGTGLYRNLCPQSWGYVCLDQDQAKMAGFKQRHAGSSAVLADARRLPFPANSFDLCLIVFVAHHLDPGDFYSALREIARILKEKGRLLLMDPLWEPGNLPGRILWSLDQGSFPRGSRKLGELLGTEWKIRRRRRFRILHDYELFWCEPAAD